MGRLGTTPVVSDAGQFPAPADKKQIYDRINVEPSPEQSLYTGKQGKTRGMGDAGIVESIPGYTPSAPQNDLRRRGAGTYTSSYDVSPTYPNYGPPRPPPTPGGWNPATQQNDLRVQGAGTYTEPYEPGQSITVVSPSGNKFVMTKEQFENLDPADQERLTEYRNYPLTSMGTAPVVEMPQISLSPEQREIVEERVDTGQIALKGTGAGLSFVSGVPGGRKLGGYLGEKYEESVKKKLDNYVLATPEQRAEMERKDPSLTAWAGIIGETPQLDRSNYTNWADKSGLRGPPDRRGGGENSGIASLGTRPRGDETTTPTPDTPSTSPGRRPDIYYMWDLSINIPSPSDPNYNQYQAYLAERLAAQRAMGYA
jgi:hypothetical protein